MVRDRAFLVSLGLSTVFHLSMVTLFSIGIWFQIDPIHYYEFEIVDLSAWRGGPRPGTTIHPGQPTLRVPSLDNPLQLNLPPADSSSPISEVGGLSLVGPDDMLSPPVGNLAQLPEVELPVVEFADLDRLRLRKRSLEIRSRRADYLLAGRPDSWARFHQELAGLRDALAHLAFFDQEPEPESPPLHRVGVAAEGFEVYVEWMGEPKTRELLFAPPIEALLRLDPGVLAEPLSFVFRVGPDGRVREVLQGSLTPNEELSVGVLRALAHYRFAPLGPGQTQDQHATLLISAKPIVTPP